MTMHVLVVDDDETIVQGVAELLQLKGYKTSVAQNGEDGLERMRGQCPDLILCDIMMPGMNGYQFYQRVRQHPDWKSIPFIFFSAKGNIEESLPKGELGACSYISKPFKPEDLLELLETYLPRSNPTLTAVS